MIDTPKHRLKQCAAAVAFLGWGILPAAAEDEIVHDAEYYVLQAQNGEQWAAEDATLDQKLAELREKYGRPPNIIHIMWDDTAFGDVGIPAIQKVRGLEHAQPEQDGRGGHPVHAHVHRGRLHAEPGRRRPPGATRCATACTTSACCCEMHGMRGEEVTIAEVLSEAGYATAFHGKWHLGDIEESYPHNQGFDEAFFTGYNQILSLWTRELGEGANASIGLYEDMLPPDPYKLDDTFVTKGWVQVAEGTKGGETRQWGDNSHENYMKIDPEAQRRTLEFIERNAKAGKPFYVANWPNHDQLPPQPEEVLDRRAASCRTACSATSTRSSARSWPSSSELGIAENTLVVCMADNGPMSHNPPPGLGMAETIFRGGKGDFLEGGVRVPAFAWWPGVIEPGQIVGDIIHETDLFTTFARLAGATRAHPHRPRHRRHRPDGPAAERRHPQPPRLRLHLRRAASSAPRSRATTSATGSRRTRSARPAASRRRSTSCRPIRARRRRCW